MTQDIVAVSFPGYKKPGKQLPGSRFFAEIFCHYVMGESFPSHPVRIIPYPFGDALDSPEKLSTAILPLILHLIRRFPMEKFAAIFIAAVLVFALLRLIALPIQWGLKIFLNSACGFFCLFLLNTISGFTGIYFPINYVTVIIAGFLGLPGIVALALMQFIL